MHFELAQADLAAIGIEITPSFGPTSELLQTNNLQGGADVWQVSNLAWVGSPDPSWGNSRFYCQGNALNGFGELNFFRYCDEEVDALIRQTDVIVDPDERAPLQPGRRALAGRGPHDPDVSETDAPRLGFGHPGARRQPIRDRPLLEHRQLERTRGGQLRGERMQPGSLNVMEPDGNEIESIYIANAILEGAFTITPDLEYAPFFWSRARSRLSAKAEF